MAGFDAERYLRVLGERARPGGEVDVWQSPLAIAARALVAVDAVAAATVEKVLREYDARIASGSVHPAEPVVALPPRRVVACDAELETGLHVRYVSLAQDETTVGVRFAGPPRSEPPWLCGPGLRLYRWQPPEPDLADDRGTTAATRFRGGGEWAGELTAAQPLAADTAWIDVDGARIALTPPAVAAEVAVEPLPEADPALRHLWRIALATDRRGGAEFEPALDALVAAGVLTRDDPRLASLCDGHGGRPPEPWRSLRAAGADGRPGTLALDAVTPQFDGCFVAVTVLESRQTHWSLEVDAAPPSAFGDPFGVPSGRSRGLAWWAVDDRGNRYAGAVGGASAGHGRAHGDVQFASPLDPLATRLEIAALAERHQALIRFPLTMPA